MTSQEFGSLSNDALLAATARLAGAERASTARLIAALVEIDARRLYLGQGYSSLFTYCVGALRLSEHAAFGRIEAARAARRFPIILERLEEGSLTLTSVGLLRRHLTPQNHEELLAAARHKSKSEVESQVAALRPEPDVSASVRKLPQRKPLILETPAPLAPTCDAAVRIADVAETRAETDPPSTPLPPERPAPRAILKPLAPERYRVQFTVSRETYQMLRRAQDLLRHQIPNGDPAAVFDRALTLLVAELEKKKLAATERPRRPRAAAPASRRIPAAVRREVWKRDGGRCAFVGADGRCTETGFLEFHHVVPFAEGGQAAASNIELRCRAHNAYEVEQWFGPMFVRERSSVWTELKLCGRKHLLQNGFEKSTPSGIPLYLCGRQPIAQSHECIYLRNDTSLLIKRRKRHRKTPETLHAQTFARDPDLDVVNESLKERRDERKMSKMAD